jgi:hypothetical protein
MCVKWIFFSLGVLKLSSALRNDISDPAIGEHLPPEEEDGWVPCLVLTPVSWRRVAI